MLALLVLGPRPPHAPADPPRPVDSPRPADPPRPRGEGPAAGFLFAMTPHVRGGLGYTPLRAGLTFVPTAVAFGVVGLNWQRPPAHRHTAAVPGGFLLAAAGGRLVRRDRSGTARRNGRRPMAPCRPYGRRRGAVVRLQPLFTRALATVRQQDAADGGGVLVTAAQLGLLTGVAVFGAVFLGAEDGTVPGAGASTDALWVTCVALAGAALCGALMSPVRRVGNLR